MIADEKYHTDAEYQELANNAGEMASCLIWDIKFLNTKSGGGLVMHKDGDKAPQFESWMTWFKRALKEGAGATFDDEILSYSRASVKDRKRMLVAENPKLAEKLNPKKD